MAAMLHCRADSRVIVLVHKVKTNNSNSTTWDQRTLTEAKKSWGFHQKYIDTCSMRKGHESRSLLETYTGHITEWLIKRELLITPLQTNSKRQQKQADSSQWWCISTTSGDRSQRARDKKCRREGTASWVCTIQEYHSALVELYARGLRSCYDKCDKSPVLSLRWSKICYKDRWARKAIWKRRL